jgi:hypothetical protein
VVIQRLILHVLLTARERTTRDVDVAGNAHEFYQFEMKQLYAARAGLHARRSTRSCRKVRRMLTCTVHLAGHSMWLKQCTQPLLAPQVLLAMSCQPALQTKCDHRARSCAMARTFASLAVELCGQNAWQHNALNHSFHHINVLSMSCFFACKLSLAAVINTRGSKGHILDN